MGLTWPLQGACQSALNPLRNAARPVTARSYWSEQLQRMVILCTAMRPAFVQGLEGLRQVGATLASTVRSP
ncbi:hypothetical protein AB688_15395 [Pseudomonas putida]|nr:hypothetical protein AB688_15395 [Pseudomonas putida]